MHALRAGVYVMGIKSYNRGSGAIARHADAAMPDAIKRTERLTREDQIASLTSRVAALERDLSRARRVLAAERYGREQLRERLAREEGAYAFAVAILCQRAEAADAALRAAGGGR